MPGEDLVRLYLSDIGRHRLLTEEDDPAGPGGRGRTRGSRQLAADEDANPAHLRELRRVVRTGDVAVDTFVKGNLRLVVSIAKRYQSADQPLLYLVQDGNLGLIRAVEKFDWRKGFKFSTYATRWIRQAIPRVSPMAAAPYGCRTTPVTPQPGRQGPWPPRDPARSAAKRLRAGRRPR